jgi:hypothetical protein
MIIFEFEFEFFEFVISGWEIREGMNGFVLNPGGRVVLAPLKCTCSNLLYVLY